MIKKLSRGEALDILSEVCHRIRYYIHFLKDFYLDMDEDGVTIFQISPSRIVWRIRRDEFDMYEHLMDVFSFENSARKEWIDFRREYTAFLASSKEVAES